MGRAAILSGLNEQAAGSICFTLVDQTVQGSVVVTRVEVRNDALRARGVERVTSVSMVLVTPQGIAAQYIVPDLTDPGTARNAAIVAGTEAPGAPLPRQPCQ